MRQVSADSPRKNNSYTNVGLYIELKDYNSYKSKGIDTADMMNDVLTENGIGTIADC